MSKTVEVTEKILAYFNAKIVGSYLFVKADLLKESDINDVDIIVHEEVAKLLRNFLKDQGYKETEPPENIQYQGWTKGSFIFEYPNEPNIHIITNKQLEVYPLEEIIMNKYERGEKKDFEQIIKICQVKLEQLNRLEN